MRMLMLLGVVAVAAVGVAAGQPMDRPNVTGPAGTKVGFLSSYYGLVPSATNKKGLIYIADGETFDPIERIAIAESTYFFHEEVRRGDCDVSRLKDLAEEFRGIIEEVLEPAGYEVVGEEEAHDAALRVAITNADSRAGAYAIVPLTYIKHFEPDRASIEGELLRADGKRLMAAISQQERSIKDWSNFPDHARAREQMRGWAERLVEALDLANELAARGEDVELPETPPQ